MAKITVNGKAQELEKAVSLLELLALNNVAQPDMVSIQLNGAFVLKDDYETIAINDGDEIDFLYFMGGGSGE
ncbi:MAG: sulfur carrier protein ThiS [Dysgonamonadaceae bacterium]|jgi:sulfur carrier protein|nr:sulfur carrier protein ThiS [Dysgonamonadaceae bacterium]